MRKRKVNMKTKARKNYTRMKKMLMMFPAVTLMLNRVKENSAILIVKMKRKGKMRTAMKNSIAKRAYRQRIPNNHRT